MRHLPGGPAASSNSDVAGYPRAQKEKNKKIITLHKNVFITYKTKTKKHNNIPFRNFLRMEIFFTFGDFIDCENIYVQFF